jgi:phospholipid/cholesterol/gamma-HCH transport system permease protein
MTEGPSASFTLGTPNPDGARDAVFAGVWRIDTLQLARPDPAAPDAWTGCRRLILKDGGITAWDSSLVVYLRRLAASAHAAGVVLDDSAMPEGVRRLLRLSDAVPERKGARRGEKNDPWLARVGIRAQRGWADLLSSIRFVGELTLAFVAMVRGRARYRKSDLHAVFHECGPGALPIVSLISLLVGMILAFLGSVQLRMFGAEVFIANGVAIGMVREMGALMTGIIMAGRTGAAFAARLGTMQVNEEVDALQTMGFSPMEFLVLPRALALILMMPLLAMYANVMGILGGALVGVLMLDLTPIQYYQQTMGALSLQSILAGLIKASVFGVLIAISGCMQGIRCGRSAMAVGEATTAAVVNAIVYIVVATSTISIIYVLTGF